MTERYQSTYVGDKFQLTRSRGAWRTIEYTLEKAASFQLTRSRGAWPWYADRFCAPSYFNSHAHVERDIFRTANECIWHYFNSHAHVERDAVFDNLIVKSDISTHTLTWSVTGLLHGLGTNFSFQLTRSRGAWLCIAEPYSHESVFQLTRSRGAWRNVQMEKLMRCVFQLTRSRGAWLATLQL